MYKRQGPGGGVRLGGEHGGAVAAAVPVVAGVQQQRAGGLPAALRQSGPGGAQFGVVESFVEGVGRGNGGGAGRGNGGGDGTGRGEGAAGGEGTG